ncbi:MAG: hypothetical protein COB04_11885 [Gammaproteobacteria bacterium]|nr:MAG: hypothetical protein COB04_11885 [Gammaproteobacteria bacterium]
MEINADSHNLVVGYLLWLLGFTGAHRFYYGRPISGTVYFFTFGLLGIGWIIDLFLIPEMDRDADYKYIPGHKNYNITWVLLTFLGLLGIHRFYMEKWLTGLLYLFTGGLFGIGYIYDYWTLNEQVTELNCLPPSHHFDI